MAKAIIILGAGCPGLTAVVRFRLIASSNAILFLLPIFLDHQACLEQGVLFLAVLAQCVKQIVPAWRRITEPEITGYFAADATGFQIVDSGVPVVVMSDLMLIEFTGSLQHIYQLRVL